jgi:hypothetical protein
MPVSAVAWRFLRFQKNSALARWYQARTADHRAATRKTMIVALARKLLIALWRFVTTGETLEGVVLREDQAHRRIAQGPRAQPFRREAGGVALYQPDQD